MYCVSTQRTGAVASPMDASRRWVRSVARRTRSATVRFALASTWTSSRRMPAQAVNVREAHKSASQSKGLAIFVLWEHSLACIVSVCAWRKRARVSVYITDGIIGWK